MRFILKRTSESFLDGEDFGLPEKYHYYQDSSKMLPNVIEFEILEELLSFEKEVGKMIIQSADKYDIDDTGFDLPILEIYDGYRE